MTKKINKEMLKAHIKLKLHMMKAQVPDADIEKAAQEMIDNYKAKPKTTYIPEEYFLEEN